MLSYEFLILFIVKVAIPQDINIVKMEIDTSRQVDQLQLYLPNTFYFLQEGLFDNHSPYLGENLVEDFIFLKMATFKY